MICKNCGKELPEGSVLCCFCGEAVEEISTEPAAEEIVTTAEEITEAAVAETEDAAVEEDTEAVEEVADETEEASEENAALEAAPKKKAKVWIIILAAVAGVALLAVLAGAILFGLGINPIEALKPRPNDIFYRENYTVEDEKARESRDVVVATIGDETLTSGELQIYYWESVMGFINNNYSYLSMYGLDINTPLNEQECLLTEGRTWQQFFLETALSSWQRYTVLQLMARDANYEMDAEMKTFLEELPTSMQTNATNYGYDSVLAWLEDNCGPGVSEEGYIEYVSDYYEGTFFLTSRYDEMSPTDAEVEAYFAENEEYFTSQGVTKDAKYYNVRHILVEIKGGTEDEEGNVTYSDEDWENCRKEAQDLLEQWQWDDGTEEGFAEFARQYSADGGSSTNGGLYENLTAETNFIPAFKEWYLEETRKPGDTGLVKNTQSSIQGYHIMYFSGSRDIWVEAATEELLADRVSAYIDEGIALYPMEVNYKKIILGDYKIA